MKSLHNSHIIRIPHTLLMEVKEKFPILKREITKTSRWLALFGDVPSCDYYIDQEKLIDVIVHARAVHKRRTEKSLLLSRMNSVFSFHAKKNSSKVQLFKDSGKIEGDHT